MLSLGLTFRCVHLCGCVYMCVRGKDCQASVQRVVTRRWLISLLYLWREKTQRYEVYEQKRYGEQGGLLNHPFLDNMLSHTNFPGTQHMYTTVFYMNGVLMSVITDLGLPEHPTSVGLIYFCLVEKDSIYLFNVL